MAEKKAFEHEGLHNKIHLKDADMHTARLKQHLKDPHSFEVVADVFKMLSDPTRTRIFWLLCHCEECVLGLSNILNMTSPAVSHHLQKLKASGLIISRRDGKIVYYTAAETQTAQLLHKAIENTMEVTCPQPFLETQEHELIRKIHDYLLQNLDKRITIDELSAQFPMNPTTMKAVFKEVYGQSIASHIKNHRMEKAAFLLETTSDTVAGVARSVGYTSQSKFAQAFCQEYGCLPGEYRLNKSKKDTV